MNFHEHLDYYTRIKKHFKRDEKPLLKDAQTFYGEMIQLACNSQDIFTYRQSLLESEWITNKRPYYNIYPAIHPMVSRLKLDIPCGSITMPSSPLSLRLPAHDNPYTYDGRQVKTVMFGNQKVAAELSSDRMVDGMVIAFDIGEIDAMGNPVYSFKIFPLRDDMSLEQASVVLPHHKSMKQGYQVKDITIRDMVKLCSVVCLIGEDPDLVTPDILAKDRIDWVTATEIQRQKMVQKAKQKGKNGYNLGVDIDLIPHYRRPHLAVVWTGKGRTLPKVVMRKGAVVHREKLLNVPTGYQNGQL